MTKDVLLSISGLHYDVTGMVQEEEIITKMGSIM